MILIYFNNKFIDFQQTTVQFTTPRPTLSTQFPVKMSPADRVQALEFGPMKFTSVRISSITSI